MKNPKFQLFQSSKNGQFYFHLTAGNGEIILSGEGYTSKQSCLNGISSVKVNASRDFGYPLNDGYGNYTFNLESTNGEIIGRSENYTSLKARDNGVKAVKRDAPEAPVEDLT
ncbi:MAG: YegP family protein [Bacteroidota bacterium]